MIINKFITYIEIYGDFTGIYRIFIACTELKIQIINQKPVFLAISPFLSDWATLVCVQYYFLHIMITNRIAK